MLTISPALQMLPREASRLERTYHRALNDLLRLRQVRESSNKKNEKRTESQDRTPTTNQQPPASEPRPQGAVKWNPPPQTPSLSSHSPTTSDPPAATYSITLE